MAHNISRRLELNRINIIGMLSWSGMEWMDIRLWMNEYNSKNDMIQIVIVVVYDNHLNGTLILQRTRQLISLIILPFMNHV